MHALVVFFIVLCGLGAAAPLHAQAVPDAGALQPPIERERTPALPQRAAPAPERDTLALPEGTTLTVHDFVFTGNKLLSDERLRAVLRGFSTGRSVSPSCSARRGPWPMPTAPPATSSAATCRGRT